MPAAASDEAEIASAMPAQPVVQLLGVDHAEHAVGIVAHLHDVVEAVQAPLARGLDGLPRHRLLAVVLVGQRPDDLDGELAAVRLELELFV